MHFLPHARGKRGITAGKPSQSLLYQALASPLVLRGPDSAPLKGFASAEAAVRST